MMIQIYGGVSNTSFERTALHRSSLRRFDTTGGRLMKVKPNESVRGQWRIVLRPGFPETDGNRGCCGAAAMWGNR
jgi:hypothetical protein